MRIKKLLGMQAVDLDANDMGKVDDVEFNSKTGEIEKIVLLSKKNILSHDEKLIHYDNIKIIGDYVLLKVSVLQDQ